MDHLYPFNNARQAISFYLYKNPARPKYVNVLEDNRGNRPDGEFLSGDHPHDIYASVVRGLVDVLKHYSRDDNRMFSAYFLMRMGKSDIAEALKTSESIVRRRLRQIEAEIEAEFRRRELIPPEEKISIS